jgi:prevent-host-death family protein
VAKVLDRVRGSKKPLIVTQRGRAAAVMLSMERYEAREREHEILRCGASPEVSRRLRRGRGTGCAR